MVAVSQAGALCLAGRHTPCLSSHSDDSVTARRLLPPHTPMLLLPPPGVHCTHPWIVDSRGGTQGGKGLTHCLPVSLCGEAVMVLF